METELIGRRDDFAIEYAVTTPRPYVHCCLWIGGAWVGNLSDPIYIETLCCNLDYRRTRNRIQPRVVYERAFDAPSFEELLSHGNWSFGESFDAFDFVYYKILTPPAVRFQWRLPIELSGRFPGYGTEFHDVSVPTDVYDPVVREFVSRMTADGLATVPGW